MTSDRARRTSPRVRRVQVHVAISMPSMLLIFWAAMTAFGVDNHWFTATMMGLLALALCNEERIRYNRRKEMMDRERR